MLLVREADRLALRVKLTPASLGRLGLSPQHKVLDLRSRAVRELWCSGPARCVDQVGKAWRKSQLTGIDARTTIGQAGGDRLACRSPTVSRLRRKAWRCDARSWLTGGYDEQGWSEVLPVNWEPSFDGNAQGLSVVVGGLGEK